MKPGAGGWLAVLAALLATGVLVLDASALGISSAPITFPSTTLNGTDQTVTGSTSAWVADAATETGGWHVNVSSTDFINGESETVDVSNFKIRLLDADIVRVSGDTTKPVSTQTSFASLSGTALKIVSAGVSESQGVYDLTPGLQLVIPAEAYTGSYTATVTITTVVGP